MNATRNRAGVILAGGASARMGEDKALLTAPSGLTLVEHIRDQFSTVVSAVAISAPLAKRYCPGVPHITDKRGGIGPCAGVEAGLIWAREHHAKILLTWPVDVPLVPAPWMNELAQSIQRGEARSCYLRATLPDGHAESQPL
ncbi:MAG: NTP transferase domain-containing protein, partial [Planctomycetaceae bacterium]|nr:NTP transferase domain-containing protein [Planctomycetaceae bacterium]